MGLPANWSFQTPICSQEITMTALSQSTKRMLCLLKLAE